MASTIHDDLNLPKPRIRELREAKGMKPADLASKVGISTQALWNIEMGRTRSPRLETARKLEEALGASYSDLWPPVQADPTLTEEQVFKGFAE